MISLFFEALSKGLLRPAAIGLDRIGRDGTGIGGVTPTEIYPFILYRCGPDVGLRFSWSGTRFVG